MSLEYGGRADKTGNTYENRFLAKLLLDLIQERFCSIEIERLGDEGVGVEYIANEVGGGRRYYQCKASNGMNNYWRPSDLNGHDVFKTAKSHITSGENHTYFLFRLLHMTTWIHSVIGLERAMTPQNLFRVSLQTKNYVTGGKKAKNISIALMTKKRLTCYRNAILNRFQMGRNACGSWKVG